jgi:hypothetical protein
MFKTHTVNFRIPGEPVINDFGEEVSEYSNEVVSGCLFSPISSEDMIFPKVQQDKTTVRIDIPKTFLKSLSNAELTFENTNSYLDGRTFKVVGNTVGFMPENTPGRWNRFIFAQEIA